MSQFLLYSRLRRKMFSAASFFLLLAVLVSPSQEHPTGDATCSLRFQEHIEKASEIEKDCGYPVFNDCCHMKAVVNLVPSGYMKTGVYQFPDPCNRKSGFIQGYSQARCDMDTDNGGWLVIQRRVEGGKVDFYRDWSDYEEGFGDLEEEFWYGLKNIHCLTNSASMELRMDLEDESGNKITWTYQEFRVEGPESKYRLHIGGGKGTPGTTDVMVYHNNMYFTTKDRDNDHYSSNCAAACAGAWWYNNCHRTNPNGQHDSSVRIENRISSRTTGTFIYYPNYEMKIRPKNCFPTATSGTCD